MEDRLQLTNIVSEGRIKNLWDGFITAESKSVEKAVWFDIFLAEFLADVKEGKLVKDILTSSATNCGSVSTLVSCELLSEVHNLCGTPGEAEELAPLRDYLLRGPGWRCLAILQCLGLQDVSCSRELASLLVSLYTVGEDDGLGESHNPYVRTTQGQYQEVVCHPQPRRHTSRSLGHAETTPTCPSRRISRAMTAPELKDELESSESEDAESSEAHQVRSSLKIHFNPMDFDYFTSVVRSDDEVRLDNMSNSPVQRKRISSKRKPEDFLSDRISDVFKHEINNYEFKVLIIDLLNNLVKTEKIGLQISGNYQLVSLQTMNFCLETLCSLQFGSDQNSKLTSQLNCFLSRLLLSSLEKVLVQPEITLSALQKGVLPVMLRLSEDILRKNSPESVKALTDPEESSMRNEYIYSIIYGVITTVHCLLIQNSSPERLEQFLSLFHQFGNSLNGRLVDKTVSIILSFSQVSSRKRAERAKKIILLVSQLITALKRTRTKIVHSRQCKKSRHKKCLTKATMHHHDNIFGCVYVDSVLTSTVQQKCSIAALFMTMTKFLSEDMERDIIIKTLHLMASCGTCCCFPAVVFLEKMMKLITNSDQRVSHCGLVLLERTFYKQMGAFEENTSCELCGRICQLNNVESSSSSLLSNSTENHQSKWSCLHLFKELLLSSDQKVVFSIGSHLLKVIPYCKIEVKQEILFSVFYPVFLKVREHSCENNSELSKFLVLTCLSVFMNLLRKVRIVEQFLEQKGMKHVMDMLKDKDATKICCSILEIVIIAQVWKKEQSSNIQGKSSNETPPKMPENVIEFDFLLKEIQSNSAKCFESAGSDSGQGDSEVPQQTSHIYYGDNTIIFESRKCYQKYCTQLITLTVLWKALANLSLFCPPVRKELNERTTTRFAHSLLLSLLGKLRKSPVIKDEELGDQDVSLSQLHLKLVEPLLVLCVVCPPFSDASDTNLTSEVLIQQIQPILNQAVSCGVVSVRQVCDLLSRVSVAQPSDRLIMPTHKMPKVSNLLWEGNDISTLTSAVNCVQLEDVSDCDSSPEITADEGYEADVEVRDQHSELEDDESLSFGSLSSSRKVSMDLKKSAQIVHPELCILAIDLVSNLVESEGVSETQLLDCVYCIQRLSREDGRQLIRHRMVSRLLTQFSDILSSNDPKYTELQRALLDLVSLLARHTIEPHELSQYIRFFTLDNPPLESLLPPLVSVVSHSEVQPGCALRFPVDCKVRSRVQISAQASLAEKTAVTMRQQHSGTDVQSSWLSCVVALPINTDLGWSMWVHGFSLAFWLRLHPMPSPPQPADIYSDSSQSETWCTETGTTPNSSGSSENSCDHKRSIFKPRLMHLISVGFDVMVLETWLDICTGKLVFRLVRPDGKKQELLCEAAINNQLSADKWHNLAINVRDSVQKRKVVIEVMLFIDGCVVVQVPLVFTGLLIRKARPSCLLMGHCGQSNSSYMISSVLMFRSPVFNKENATRLVAYGPDYIHLTQADVGNIKPNLSTVVTVKSIEAGVNWESVFHEQTSNLRELQENLLLSYSAENYNNMNAYPQAISSATGVVGSLFPPSPGFRVATVDNRASQFLPMSIRPLFFAPLQTQHYHGITVAADTIGGIPIFLFLFARVVELKGSEESQAQALYILLKLAQSSCELNSQFESKDVTRMLCHVLASPRCTPSLVMLKMLMDVCCDRPGLLTVHPSSGQVSLGPAGSLVVTEPSLLAGLVLGAWRQWARTPSALFTLLQALQALLRDDHPYREFNVAQFNRAQLLDSLLMFCKEMFLSGEKAVLLEPRVCPAVVELVRSLIGAPPELPHIVLIYDYLVLAHPASATYVTSVRPNFYFLVNTSSSNHPSSNHSEVDPNNGSLRKSKSMFNSLNEVPEPTRRHLTQPVDPTKLNKALANLQIKQLGQQHNPVIEVGLDTNRCEIFTSSGQGSMDEFSSDDKLNCFASESLPSDPSPIPPPPPPVIEVDDEKEKAEIKQEEVDRLQMFKRGNHKKQEVRGSVDCVTGVTEGLLLLLRDVMLVLPDSMVHQVLSHVIKVQALLVMANHHSPEVRSAVVKVLSSYLQRASEDDINAFVRMRGYFQLANQLGQWPGTPELVEGAVSLVTGLHWLPLEEQLCVEYSNVSPLTLAALPPLLALLPNCVHNLPLSHHVLHFLQRLFTKVVQNQRALIDCGLIETLCKTIVAINHFPSQPTDLCGVNEKDLLISDIQNFLVLIVSNATHSPGNHNMQVLTDILVILRYLERSEVGQAPCITSLRTTQAFVLSNALHLIQEKITTQQNPISRIRSTATAFLSSVLSPGFDEMVDLQSSLNTTSKSKSSSNSDSVNSLTSSSYSFTSRPNKVPRSEIIDRFKMIITKATEFFVYSDSSVPLSKTEDSFARQLLILLLSGMLVTVDRKFGGRNAWSTVVWNCRDTVRTMTGQFVVWLLSPGQTNDLRMFAIVSLRNQLKAKDVISSIVLSSSQVEQQFVLYLWELMYGSDSSSLAGKDRLVCVELTELLQAWGIYSQQSIGRDYDPWTDDLAVMARSVYNQRALWTKQQEAVVNRTITRMEPVVKAVSEAAMVVTRVVVDAQNMERKAMMESLRQSLSDSVHAQIQWKVLTQQLTHERAVWHFPQSYPRSWQLDETEGPVRVKKRLKRCHLNVEKRFLKPEFQDKLDAAARPQPLSYLFGSEGPSTADVLKERLHTDEKIRHMVSARIVTPAQDIPGELLIGETSLYFVPNNEPSKNDVNLASSLDACSQAWQLEDVKEIHNRRFQLQELALEIFLLNGKTYLLAFESSTERDQFSAELGQCDLPHRVANDHLSDTVQLWREGHLTNWEYLTTLNKMAGRSYNDLMQYPVMPFVLADYTSPILDLTDPKSYRNLKKPMAVQEKQNEYHYIHNYNYLKQEFTNALNLVSINQEPYHYASHYSNSGTVLHFLVRLSPFTSMFIKYQDDNFDLPDRTFHSIQTTWRLTSSESASDVKELIPEFFFLPEFLSNQEGYNFGERQNGEKVDNVELPTWACGDARRFTLIHSQALESDYVRENLPHWIDLVFGYKQTGKAAVDAINVFHPATYYGFNPELVDNVEKKAFDTIIQTYGQTPRQLFRAAHPMVVQSLAPKTSTLSSTLGVKGVAWGNYVGSPSDSVPSVIWQQNHRTPVASLIPLLTNDVFGLAPSTALLLAYSKEKTLSLVATGGTCVLGAALVSWGHADGVLRAKLRKEQPPYPAVRPPRSGGPVTTCVSVPDCNQLWIGYSTGKILVYRYKFKPSKGTLEFSPQPVELMGHNAAVLSLTLCRAYSVALSGAADGSVIIWDLNRLSYVRSLPNISLPVSLSCVSEISGDLVTVGSDTESGGSTVRLHTINVTLVGSVTTRDHITAVCFSTAPDGVAINVIATGMSNGVIRLWSTWDLSAVGEIVVNSIDHPIIGLTYSHDSQHLYASTDNGSVVIWEGSAAKGGSKTPKFLNLTTLI